MDKHAIKMADWVVAKYKTRDPDVIIDSIACIKLVKSTMYDDLLGYYYYRLNKHIIGINDHANRAQKRSGKGHELGHYFCERLSANSGGEFKDTFFYSTSTAKSEMTANTFAGELLLSDEMVLEPMCYDYFMEARQDYESKLSARCSTEYRAMKYYEMINDFFAFHSDIATADDIAREQDVDPNLVDFKIRILSDKGYELPKLPDLKSDFLKDAMRKSTLN